MPIDAHAEDSHEENRRLSTPGQRYDARLGQRSLASILQQRVIDNEQRTLAAALEQVRADGSALALSGTVVAARRRFIAGSGKSFAYANLLSRDLSAGLSQVFLIDETVIRSIDILSETKSTDVLVAFSFRRYRRDTIDLARRFAQAGGTVVGITDDPASPINAIASDCIIVPTDSVSYADSPTAIAAVVHLVATLCTSSAKGAKRRLAERDRLSAEYGLYLEI